LPTAIVTDDILFVGDIHPGHGHLSACITSKADKQHKPATFPEQTGQLARQFLKKDFK